MAKSVTINGTTYTLNQQGDPQPWGEDLSDILQALVDVATTSSGTGDILNTSFSIANNQSVAANVTGLQFDPSVIRSALINYSIYRSTASAEASECGVILVTYKSTANTWELSQYYVGDAGITFTCLASGQLQYVSTNLSGASYVGTLKFSAKAFTQS